MKIIRFSCRKVHGYLSFDLLFNQDVTFLTGINGSGKTSAVRAITALLTPSLRDLANMDYQELKVAVEDEGHATTITAQRSDEGILLSCADVPEVLMIPVLRSDAYEPRTRFSERAQDFYREQEAINARNSVLVRVERLPTPMFLDLERRHQIGARQTPGAERYSFRPTPSNALAGSLIDSLKDAQDLAETGCRQLLAKRAQLTDQLKQDIILTAFQPGSGDDSSFGLFIPSKPFMRQVERNEHVVEHSLSQIGISTDRIADIVKPFFAHARQVADRLPDEKTVRKRLEIDHESVINDLQQWSAIHPQLMHINRLVDLISKYNTQVQATMEPLERYRTSINAFLADSGKELLFDESGNLRVSLRGQSRPRPITALSSGERQLVVILTHLAFKSRARRADVLIIDEPELSLHLRWQELFVDAVMNASPGIQLILATHSPSIIKGRIDHCVDVEEAHRSDSVLARG